MLSLTKLADDSIEAGLGGHVHQPPPQAVVGEHQEHLLADAADVLQLHIVKVLEDKGGDCGDDADEQVDAGQGHEGRARDGEDEGEGVHQGHRGPAIHQHQQDQGAQVIPGDVGLGSKHQEDDDAETSRDAEIASN